MIFESVSQFHIHSPCSNPWLVYCRNRFLIVKALVWAYNKEKALGAFLGYCETSRRFVDSSRTNLPLGGIDPSGRLFISFIVLPIFANFLELLESKRQSLLLSSANSLNLSFINIEMGKFSNKILKFLSFLFQFWKMISERVYKEQLLIHLQ